MDNTLHVIDASLCEIELRCYFFPAESKGSVYISHDMSTNMCRIYRSHPWCPTYTIEVPGLSLNLVETDLVHFARHLRSGDIAHRDFVRRLQLTCAWIFLAANFVKYLISLCNLRKQLKQTYRYLYRNNFNSLRCIWCLAAHDLPV